MDKIKDYLPVSTVVVIILGYLDLFFYYHHFDIDIYNYLTVPDIIFSFSLVLVMVTGAILYCLSYYGGELRMKEKVIITSIKGHIIGHRVSVTTFLTCLGLIILGMLFGVLGMEGIVPLHNISEGPTIGLLFLWLFIPQFFLHKPLIASKAATPEKKIRVVVSFVTILAFYLYLINSIKSAHIDQGLPKFSVELTRREQPPIKTNKNFIYIGATSNYFFFKSMQTNKFVVIPKSEVTEIRQVRLRIGL